MNAEQVKHLKSWWSLVTMCLLFGATVSANEIFRDDSTGQSLSPEWELIGADPDRMTSDGESFLFLTTTDLRGLCYKATLPSDYYVEAKIVAPLQAGTRINLVLMGDKDNYILIRRYTDILASISAYMRVLFIKSQRGRESKYDSGPIAGAPEILLILQKRGSKYIGYFGDGKKQLGHEQIFLNFEPSKICINAANDSLEVPEVPVQVDYFEIGQ